MTAIAAFRDDARPISNVRGIFWKLAIFEKNARPAASTG